MAPLFSQSADFIRTQLEAMTDPAGRARILSQLDRLQPPLNVDEITGESGDFESK